MADTRRVHVVYTKWGGRPHLDFECRRLGEDQCGVWLAGPPGTQFRRVARASNVAEHGFVQLVPHRGDWMAFFNAAGRFDIYVDVTSAPVWAERSVTCVDLDLDVVRLPDGRVD